jgi:DNA-binding beta-propeller fold protein YncE
MNLARTLCSAGVLLLFLLCVGCGDTYRPVATPIIPNPPNPGFSKAAFVISNNGPQNPGSSTQIDVSGDTALGVLKTGVGPVHAALTPDSTKMYVANEFEDTISEFPPGTPNATDLNPVVTIGLPSGSHPVFVGTAQNGTMFSANFLSGTVTAISTSQNAVTQVISLAQTGPSPDIQPVALAETPDGSKLYVANQGNRTSTAGSVSSISPADNSINAAVMNSWVTPVWVVARSDSARAYILDAGAGMVFAINTSSDMVLPNPVNVGVGANFMFYDQQRSRLYVTNPASGSVSIIDISGDPPALLATDCVVSGSVPPCPTSFAPIYAAVLPDGSSAYVASYQISATCSGVASPCITSQVSVINSNSNLVSAVIPLGTVSIDMTDITGCGAPGPVGSSPPARFRLSVAASGDSSRVYVANCDAGNTTIISAVPTSSDLYPANTVITSLQSPVSAFPPGPSTPAQPPPQAPVFVLATP